MPALDRWCDIWGRLGAPAADQALFHELNSKYREPHRRYHTLQHLDECFEHLQIACARATNLSEVELALWFHDAVYELGHPDNEQRSAAWAADAMLAARLPAAQRQRVQALILATARAAAPADADARLLVDVDLCSLGAPPARFEECEHQIREENAMIPESLYRTQRKQLLLEFLARPRIYFTPEFQDAFEAPARRNLAWSLARL